MKISVITLGDKVMGIPNTTMLFSSHYLSENNLQYVFASKFMDCRNLFIVLLVVCGPKLRYPVLRPLVSCPLSLSSSLGRQDLPVLWAFLVYHIILSKYLGMTLITG